MRRPPDYVLIKHLIKPLEYNIMYFKYLGVSDKDIAKKYGITEDRMRYHLCLGKQAIGSSSLITKETKSVTICMVIKMLYMAASLERRKGQMKVLRRVFIMAKKMNRKLTLNKFGYLPQISKNSWKEKDWKDELKGCTEAISIIENGGKNDKRRNT